VLESSDDVNLLDDISDCGIAGFFPLRIDEGIRSVFGNLIPNFLAVRRACATSAILHSDGAGWAFPLSFYLLLLRFFYSFQWIIVIESSPWMLAKGERKTIRKLLSHCLHSILLRSCLRLADARIFTQSFYRRYFLGKDGARTLIAPATWVDADRITTSEFVHERWGKHQDKPLQLLFPARLVSDKGVHVLLAAINILSDRRIDVHVAIMGMGELQELCSRFANEDHGTVTVSFVPPVEYGAHFDQFLSRYDAIVVANLKEEQPRIVFDAFSQGVGVIASDTTGIRDITIDKQNAIQFARGDAHALAQAITFLAENRDIVLQLGLCGLNYVRSKTHEQMHRQRKDFLMLTLDGLI
jgi:glycosyltransferase involved in cell wall biosynthesis